MNVQPTSADARSSDVVFWDDVGSQTTQQPEQLWPGKRVIIAKPQRRPDLYLLYTTWCTELASTVTSASFLQCLYSRMEDYRQTGNTSGNLIFTLMEEAAQAEDPRRFAAWADLIDWSTSTPDELVRTIELTLSLELVALARELTLEGTHLFPNHERLRQAAQVLAPPSVQPQPDMPPAEGLEVSMAWLSEHASQYRGQWVAVRSGRLIATTATLQELEASIGQDTSLESTIVAKVL